jgi:hypothetical protein
LKPTQPEIATSRIDGKSAYRGFALRPVTVLRTKDQRGKRDAVDAVGRWNDVARGQRRFRVVSERRLRCCRRLNGFDATLRHNAFDGPARG